MKKTFNIILTAFLATTAVIKAAPALSEPAPTTVSETVVRTADLDLSTEAGRRQLDQRLVVAVRDACGAAADVDLAGQNVVRQCRHDVLADARAKTQELIASTGGDRTVRLATAR
jgi:UrcA family protein